MAFKKFFDFNNEDYNNLFCMTLIKVLQAYPNAVYFHKILELKKIDLSKFMNSLEEKCKNTTTLHQYSKTITRSPNKIQSKSYLWPYYSLYHTFNLYSSDMEIDKNIEKIINMVFSYHYNYIRCIESNTDNLLYKLERISVNLTRVIEILYAIKSEENEEIYNKYFDTNQLDLYLHFIEQMDKKEVAHYFIDDKESKNYMKYVYDDKQIKINVTRVLHKTDNVIEKIIESYDLYSDFLAGELDLSRKIQEIERSKIKTAVENYDDEIQQKLSKIYNQNGIKFSTNKAEQIEQLSKEILAYRDEDNAGNLFRQRLRNRAYSANIAKQNLITTKHYAIPPLPLLKEFIASLYDKHLKEEEKVFCMIFAFGVISAQSYYRTIRILSEEFDEIEFKLDKNEMWTKINKNLFSKVKDSDYFEKKVSKVNFSLPYLFSFVFTDVKKIVLLKKEYFLSDETEKEYHKFFQDRTQSFYKTLQIDTKNIHKLSRAYLRENGQENISAMFYTAIYSKNETAKMAYASVTKTTDYFSDYILSLYEALDLDNIFGSYLDINIRSEIKKNIEERIYAGSNLLVKEAKVKDFFLMLYDFIFNEVDQYKRFNYISIYVRYAMSLLAGTRTFQDSADLSDVSFVFKVMKLSEKSETKLSGLRIVPLCDEILFLIKFYKEECEKYQLDSTKFYIYLGNDFETFSIKNILKLRFMDRNILHFIEVVPLNFGRHIFTKFAIEQGVAQDHIDAFLGHYVSGLEQTGIYSTLDVPTYIESIRDITSRLALLYKIQNL